MKMAECACDPGDQSLMCGSGYRLGRQDFFITFFYLFMQTRFTDYNTQTQTFVTPDYLK